MKQIVVRHSLMLALIVAILVGFVFSGQLQAAPPAQGNGGLSAAEVTELLNLHNEWRERFGTPALVWDASLAAFAQDWANQVAASGTFAHRQNNNFGENMWAGTTGFFGPSSVVNSWGSEVADYDFATNTCTAGKACGHFTQLVWANTAKVGCGKATGHGNDYYVCNYDPPGNFVGEKPGARPAALPATVQPEQPAPTAPVPTATTASSNAEPTAIANSAATAEVTAAATVNKNSQATPKGTANVSAGDALALLSAHNAIRAKHNVPALVWDDAVAEAAEVWAQQIATTGSFSRPANNTFGSNNYFGTVGFVSPQDPVEWWGEQSANYDFATNICAAGKECRAFTQIVWANSARVGCGKAVANNNEYYVCNYDPPGNVSGETPGATAEGAATNTPNPTQAAQTATPSRTPSATRTPTEPANVTLTSTRAATGGATATRTVTRTPTLSASGTTGLTAAAASELLNLHNEWRERFGTSPLAWDDSLATFAQEWADQMADRDEFEHRPDNKFGENIWAGTTGFFGPPSVVNSWGDEVADYDFASNTCAMGKVCGHFTQVVWANTTKLGCGKATANGNDYYVCNYDPPGNVAGQTPGAKPAAPPADAQPTPNAAITAEPTADTAEPPAATVEAGGEATETPEATTEPITAPTEAPLPTLEAVTATNTSPESAISFDTPNQVLPAGGLLWYTIPYAGGDAEITIRIPDGANAGLLFQVFTPSEIANFGNTTHTGMGHQEGSDLVWSGSSPEEGPLFLVIANNSVEQTPLSIVVE